MGGRCCGVHLLRTFGGRFSGGRLQLASDLRCERADRHTGHCRLAADSERVEESRHRPVRLERLRERRSFHAVGHLRAGPGQCVGQPARLDGLGRGRLVRRGGRRAGRVHRPRAADGPSAARHPPVGRPSFRRLDARVDYLRHRHVRRQLSAAALHAERSGLYGADGRYGFPAGRTDSGSSVDRFGHSYSLCRRAAARVRRHRRDGAELFPGQPVYGSHAPFRYHGRRLSAGIRHGTDLRAAERFLASEPESEPDGCCGGHI